MMSAFDYKLYESALLYALKAHDGQPRKYVGGPYIAHPIRVAGLLMPLPDSMSEKNYVIMAALLHDVVEDCGVSIQTICDDFGSEIATLVDWLTKVDSIGNRAQRKLIDQEKLALAPNPAKLIKCADLIDNTESIVEHDPKFAKVYLPEKWRLLHAMRPDYDPLGLHSTAMSMAVRGAQKLDIALPSL